VFHLFADEKAELPDGVIPHREGHPDHWDISLASNYPSASQPHRRIGDLTFVVEASLSPPDTDARLAAVAGAHGANAVVVMSGHAVALRLSGAPVPKLSAEVLAEQGVASLPDYRALEPRVLPLEHAAPFVFAGKKGRCYALVIGLDSDADWSKQVRAGGLALGLHAREDLLAHPKTDRAAVVNAEAPVAPRLSIVDVSCALGDLPIEVGFWSVDRAITTLGTGHAKLVLLEKTLDAAAAAELEQEARRAYMFHTTTPTREWVAKHDCALCAGSAGGCRLDDVASCMAFQACLVTVHHDTRVDFCLRQH